MMLLRLLLALIFTVITLYTGVVVAHHGLNLLPVFEAAYEERSLSKAALRLAITQSAVSHALRRLRAAGILGGGRCRCGRLGFGRGLPVGPAP